MMWYRPVRGQRAILHDVVSTAAWAEGHITKCGIDRCVGGGPVHDAVSTGAWVDGQCMMQLRETIKGLKYRTHGAGTSQMDGQIVNVGVLI